MKLALVLLAGMVVSTVSQAGAVGQAQTLSTDHERLEKAKAVVAAFFPAASRQQMLSSMNAAQSANLRTGMLQSAPIKEVVETTPAAKPVFEEFLAEEERYSGEKLKADFPKLLDAMAAAYARRFTTGQLEEIHRFFLTPTGQHYVQESMSILSDPDVARVQAQMMADAMNRLPTQVPKLVSKLKAAGAARPSSLQPPR